jgi:hypothetical protein
MREPETKHEEETIEKYEELVKIHVNELDPIKLLAQGASINEYEKEIRDITLRLPLCKSYTDIAEMMYVVFAYNFTIDMAKPESQYSGISIKIAIEMGIFNPVIEIRE